MSLLDETTLRIVIYEGNGAQPLESDERFEILSGLLEKGYAVTRTAAQGAVAPADHSSLLVLGRFANGRTAKSARACFYVGDGCITKSWRAEGSGS